MWQSIRTEEDEDPFAEFDGRTSRRRPTYYDHHLPLSGISSKPFILAHCRSLSPVEAFAL